ELKSKQIQWRVSNFKNFFAIFTTTSRRNRLFIVRCILQIDEISVTPQAISRFLKDRSRCHFEVMAGA
ncbi:MAG: hypothetical protein KZQ78_03675, partial [Candidatus Thiodiazotropha sp. (ex Ustalcina ferruginea)]|nr:hypothetical protein [Candidatus Thiodiazotropha sp. (ex Ustalcina ferruginea)]